MKGEVEREREREALTLQKRREHMCSLWLL